MGSAIGQSLPIAVGVLVSPLPIVAVILMLVSGAARANAITFVVAWFLGIGAVTTAVALLAGSTGEDDAPPAAWTAWLKIALGAGLLWLSLQQWRKRPRQGAEPATPAWMTAVDGFTPPKAAGLALLLGVVNPKNLLLVVSGGAAIASAAPGDTSAQVVAGVVFAIVASLGVSAPVVVYLRAGDQAKTILDELKTWMIHNNAIIMCVVLLVLGAKLLGDGVSLL